jgi:hypothetical protein
MTAEFFEVMIQLVFHPVPYPSPDYWGRGKRENVGE